MDVAVERKKLPRLTVVETGDLSSITVPPISYVISPILPRGFVTILAGHGGTGKSVLALTYGAHVAAARSWNGSATQGGTVVYLSLEDSANVALSRLKQICSAYELDIGTNLIVIDGSDIDGVLFRDDAKTHVVDELMEYCAGVSLIIIDNASDAFDADENNRRQVRAFLRILSALARKSDAALLLIAHIDKNAARNGAQGNSYSGSVLSRNGLTCVPRCFSRSRWLSDNPSISFASFGRTTTE